MSLLPYNAFSAIFGPYSGQPAGYIQGWFGNAGDSLIHFGTLELFKAFNIPVQILNEKGPFAFAAPRRPLSAIFFFGGGSMGYKGPSMLLRQKARQAYQNCACPLILLPQSWRGAEPDAHFARVFARESRTAPPAAVLAPDLALGFTPAFSVPPPAHEGVAVWLRADGESALGGIRKTSADPVSGLNRLSAAEYLERAAQCPALITDRLHFAIAGLLAKRKVCLLPNNYPKNIGVYEHWLKGLGVLWAAEPEQALSMLNRVV